MAHAGDRAIRRVEKFFRHRHPDMRVRVDTPRRRDDAGQSGHDRDEALDHRPPRKVSSRFAAPDSGRRLERRVGRKRGLHPRRSAIAARIVGAFESAVDMQDRGAGMAHNVGVGVGQNFQIMAGRGELIDEIAGEA